MITATAVDCRDLFRVHRTPEGDAAALQGLTLQVASGEAVALLGPSGSGKSSLLRVLAGFDTPSAGRAQVFGHDLSRASTRARTRLRRDLLGLVQQHSERVLPPDLTVRDAVALPLTLRGTPRRDAARIAATHLERVGLGVHGSRRPDELSGGERQRAAIAAAIGPRPQLLLADEPTGELDAASAREVLLLLRELTAESGMAMLLVTHDPATAAAMDRRVHLRDGRISDEDRGDGRTAVLVDRAGWLRLPAELLREAGITDRAAATVSDGQVVLTPTDTGSTTAVSAPGRAALPRADHGGATVTATQLRRTYGPLVVLDDLTVRVDPGTFAAVTGRSGSGKSTLLRLLAGLEGADSGRIDIDGADPAAGDRTARAHLRAKLIAYVGQGEVLLPDLSVLEQPGTTPQTLAPWLGLLGLGERARQPVRRLSGGERQRAAIARALASGRPLILLDEPTSRLDAASADTLGSAPSRRHRAPRAHRRLCNPRPGPRGPRRPPGAARTPARALTRRAPRA